MIANEAVKSGALSGDAVSQRAASCPMPTTATEIGSESEADQIANPQPSASHWGARIRSCVGAGSIAFIMALHCGVQSHAVFRVTGAVRLVM